MINLPKSLRKLINRLTETSVKYHITWKLLGFFLPLQSELDELYVVECIEDNLKLPWFG